MAFQGDSIFWVEVEKIVPNPFQPRKEFNQDRLSELAESIRMYGVLQPLTVTRKEIQEDNGAFHTEYELIAGERRLRASKLAGLEQVPVIIRSGEDTEQEKLELAIIENLQREDLNAVDRALAFKQLADVFNLSHSQVGKKVGRSRMYVSNSIRLLSLPECILNSLSLGDITEGHARTLLMLKDRPEEQDVVYREIMLKKLSVREVERIARKIATDKVRKKKWKNTDAHLIEIEKEFTNTLGTRVQIAKTDFGGKLTIDYFSDEDLEKLLHLVKSQGKITQMETAPKREEVAEETSTTVIHEMSPEASTLAKVAATTALEVVEPEKDLSSEGKGERIAEGEVSVQEAPSMTTEESTTDMQEMLSENNRRDEVHSEPSEETVDFVQNRDEDVVSTEEDVSELSEDKSSVDDTEKGEFAFITSHTEEARAEDLIIKTDFEKSFFRDVVDDTPSPSSHEVTDTSDKSEDLSQSPSEQPDRHQENMSPTESATDIPKDDEGDLYSIKHFSL